MKTNLEHPHIVTCISNMFTLDNMRMVEHITENFMVMPWVKVSCYI